MSKPDNGFDEFLAVFTEQVGKPSPSMAGYLESAYKAGHAAGGSQATQVMFPAVRAAMEMAETGRDAYLAIRNIPDQLSELLDIPEDVVASLRDREQGEKN